MVLISMPRFCETIVFFCFSSMSNYYIWSSNSFILSLLSDRPISLENPCLHPLVDINGLKVHVYWWFFSYFSKVFLFLMLLRGDELFSIICRPYRVSYILSYSSSRGVKMGFSGAAYFLGLNLPENFMDFDWFDYELLFENDPISYLSDCLFCEGCWLPSVIMSMYYSSLSF